MTDEHSLAIWRSQGRSTEPTMDQVHWMFVQAFHDRLDEFIDHQEDMDELRDFGFEPPTLAQLLTFRAIYLYAFHDFSTFEPVIRKVAATDAYVTSLEATNRGLSAAKQSSQIEMQARIDELEKKVEALEAENKSQKEYIHGPSGGGDIKVNRSINALRDALEAELRHEWSSYRMHIKSDPNEPCLGIHRTVSRDMFYNDRWSEVGVQVYMSRIFLRLTYDDLNKRQLFPIFKKICEAIDSILSPLGFSIFKHFYD